MGGPGAELQAPDPPASFMLRDSGQEQVQVLAQGRVQALVLARVTAQVQAMVQGPAMVLELGLELEAVHRQGRRCCRNR